MKTHSGHIYLQPWHIKPGVKERLLKDIQEVAKELMEGPKEKLEGRVGQVLRRNELHGFNS